MDTLSFFYRGKIQGNWQFILISSLEFVFLDPVLSEASCLEMSHKFLDFIQSERVIMKKFCKYYRQENL